MGKKQEPLEKREHAGMNLQRRQIQFDEIEIVHEILKQCGQDMKARLGLGHWDPPYPLDLLRKSAQERLISIVLNDEQIVATFTLGMEAPPYYRTIPGLWHAWNPRGEPAMYVNRLAVRPEFQGQGIGTWCVREIEGVAHQAGCEAIRLDAYDKYDKLVAWYQHLGYHSRGAFSFYTKAYGETGMICLEKMKKQFRTM
jgi:GNAT superfamily N-acetyltransferase